MTDYTNTPIVFRNKRLKTTCVFEDQTDATKDLAFSLQNQATGTTCTLATNTTAARTWTLPDSDGTLAITPAGGIVDLNSAQTLTNKNLSSATNTFPTSLATLTGSQALTNKDLTSGTNTFPTSLATLTGSQALTNKDLTSGTNTFPPSLLTQTSGDARYLQLTGGTETGSVAFNAGLSTATIRGTAASGTVLQVAPSVNNATGTAHLMITPHTTAPTTGATSAIQFNDTGSYIASVVGSGQYITDPVQTTLNAPTVNIYEPTIIGEILNVTNIRGAVAGGTVYGILPNADNPGGTCFCIISPTSGTWTTGAWAGFQFGDASNFLVAIKDTGMFMNAATAITLTAPNVSIVNGSATLTLPTSTDTLAGIGSTQTLTAKKLRLQNGSTGDPAIAFDSDTDLGLYRVASNQLGFCAGGSQLAQLDSSQFLLNGGISAGGAIYAPAGNASTPSLSFSGDQNSGVYSSGANEIGVTVNGTQIGNINTLGFLFNDRRPLSGSTMSFYPATDNSTATSTLFISPSSAGWASTGTARIQFGDSNHQISAVNGSGMTISDTDGIKMGTNGSSFKQILHGQATKSVNLNQGQADTQSISFGATLSAAPRIIISSVAPSTQLAASAESITTTGFTAVWTNYQSGNFTNTATANWIAIVS